jgi:adenylate cyclase
MTRNAASQFAPIAQPLSALKRARALAGRIWQWVYLQRKTFDLAETYLHSALEMNPSNPVHVALYGDLLTYQGRPGDAIEWYDQARRLDRFRPTWHWRHLGIALFAARRYDDAIAAFDRSPIKLFWAHAYAAACYAQSGRSELARKSTAEVVLCGR